jgi:hypothetical protein
MTTERKATIRRTREDVFAMLIDVERLPEWRDALVSITRLSPPGPVHGATYRETMNTPFGHKSATVQLSAEAPTRFTFRVIDGPVRPHGSIVLHERDGATHLTFRVALAPLFALPSLADTVAAAFLRKAMDRSLARLREILEREERVST